MDSKILESIRKQGRVHEIQEIASHVAAGLAVNAQVCMRQWNPELIASKALEIAEDIYDATTEMLKPDPE